MMEERTAVSAAAADAIQDADIGAAVAAVMHAAKRRWVTVLDLAAAEVRLAAMSTLTMALLAIVAGAALIIAWGLLVALMLYFAMRAGIGWPGAAFVLAIVHVGVAYGAWRATVRLSRNLTLPSLRGVFVAPTPPAPSSYVPVEDTAGARRA